MKQKLSTLLILILWLSACTTSPAAPATLPAIEAPSAEASSTAEAETQPTETNDQVTTTREAVISEFDFKVSVRVAAEGDYILATPGMSIQVGGAVQTNATGHARLDLKPEGTIVRVAPNSAFTLSQLEESKGEPKSAISLFFGKIFIMLNGGSLDVQTPSGVASVRGSVMSVSYDPELDRIQVACLEGVCSLIDDEGNEVYMNEGESAYVEMNGQIVQLEGIDQGEILIWLEEVPELKDFMNALPNPNEYPNIEGFNEYVFDPLNYYGEQTNNGVDVFNLEEGTFFATEEPGETPTDESGSTDSGDGGDTSDSSGGEGGSAP